MKFGTNSTMLPKARTFGPGSRRRPVLHAVWLTAAVMLAGCGGLNLGGGKSLFGGGDKPDTQAVNENTVSQIKDGGGGAKVALLLPLTAAGRAGEIARGLKEAGELALFDTNDPSIVLIPKDTRGTPGGAQAAAKEAVAEGAQLILGPLFAGSVKAVAPIAQAASIPVIAYSTDKTVAGNGVFLLSFLPEQEVSRVVSYATSRGKKKFGALLPGSPYGALIEQAMVASVPRNGGKLSAVERFNRSSSGIDEPVKKMAEATKSTGKGVQAIMVAEGGDLLRSIGASLQKNGVNTGQVQLLGTGLWDQPGIEAMPGLSGGWFAGPPPSSKGAFNRRFKSAYGREPPRIASLSYDSVSLAVALARSQPQNSFAPSRLTNPEGFAGIDGLFRFLPNGLNQRGLAVMEVTPTGYRVISQPPSKFSGAGF